MASGEPITGATDAGSTGTSTTDTSSADTSQHAEGGDGGEGAAAKPEGEGPKKRHIKWLGRDMELTEDELAARFDDDYEWEFHGVGGKPLMRDGQPVKVKWPEMLRHVQMGNGYADAARKANETRKQYEDRIAWGKDPQNRMAFIERELGVEDSERWLIEEAAKVYQNRQKMVQLAQQDPMAYERELSKSFMSRKQAREDAEARMQQQQQLAQRREHAQQSFRQSLSQEFQRNGVPMNARTLEIAQQIARDYHETGAEPLGYPQLAQYAQEQYENEVFGYLDKRSDEELLKKLGDKRRERLRRAELASLKVAKKQQAPATNEQRREPPKPTGMTAEDFLRQKPRGRA